MGTQHQDRAARSFGSVCWLQLTQRVFGGAKYRLPGERAVFGLTVVCFGTSGRRQCSGTVAVLLAYRISAFDENRMMGKDACFFDTHEFFMLVSQ